MDERHRSGTTNKEQKINSTRLLMVKTQRDCFLNEKEREGDEKSLVPE